MKAIGVFFSILGCMILGISAAASETQTISHRDLEKMRDVASGNTAFALDLYRELRKKEGNVFFSPFSVHVALGMTYWGARGNTASQMARALHFTMKDEDLRAATKMLLRRLNGKETMVSGHELIVANALWGQKGFEFFRSYLDILKENYDADLRSVDFANATEVSRRTINQWVEDETRNRIKDLIKKGVLNRDTRLVLTNAIYFKGDWAKKFNPDNTEDRPFHMDGGKKIDVPLMYHKGSFAYAQTDDIQILELPYAGEELSMIVLLPKEGGLKALEESLTSERYGSLMGLPRISSQVDVYLPRFEMTFEAELKGALISLGMEDAFRKKMADFSGIAKDKLFLKDVVHSAFVEVNEKGTEAAAATGVALQLVSQRQPVVFRADRPFLFVIQEKTTRSILFLGRVSNPS